MRVVPDVNILVSGLLWDGAPAEVLRAANRGSIQLITCVPILAELADVLSRPKLARRVAKAELTPSQLVYECSKLCTLVTPADLPGAVPLDSDDDVVLGCAVAASASVVVTGDHHLLTLKSFRSIKIVTAAELMVRIERDRPTAPAEEE